MRVLARDFLFAEPPFPFAHTPTLFEVAPGRLIAGAIGGPAARDPANAVWIVHHDGRRWGRPVKVTDWPVACWNPVLTRNPRDGELLLFYKVGLSPQVWTGALARSTDEGRSWSPPEILPAGLTGPVRSKPLALEDGALLCGDSVESWEAWSCWVNLTPDGGRTWSRFGPIVYPGQPHGLIQPTLFWSDAARTMLRMLMRPTEKIGRVCQSQSTDLGRTWSPARATELPNPNSAIDAVRLRDGRIALVHNDTTSGRERLALNLSADGGLSWARALVLEEEPGEEFSYPAVIEDAAGRLQVLYTWKKRNIGHVTVAAGDPR